LHTKNFRNVWRRKLLLLGEFHQNEPNGAITGVAVANDNTFGLNPALNVRRAPSARRQVDVQANTAILTELVKQSELAKVTLLGGIIVGFLTIFGLISRKIFKNYFNET
jgi:hypothetical protein